jgi:O-antigen/teichoic acid export membrane protein
MRRSEESEARAIFDANAVDQTETKARLRGEAPRAESSVESSGIFSGTQRAIAVVYVGHLFRYVYLLILIPFYGRVLGAAEYGRLLSAMSLYQIVWMVVEYGFPLAGVRDVATTSDPTRLGEIYGQHFAGRAVMSVPGLLIGIGGTALSPLLAESPIYGVLATLAAVASAFNVGWFFQGISRFRLSTILEASGFVITLPMILLLVRDRDDGWLVLASLLFASVVCSIAGHVVALRFVARGSVRLRSGWRLVRESTALFAVKGTSVIMTSSSTYLVSLFATAAQVGWFGAAERLASVAISMTLPAHRVLVSTVCQRLGTDQTQASAQSVIRIAFLIMTGAGVLVMLGTFALGGFIVPLVLGPEFGPAVPMLHILALMFPFAGFSQVVASCILIPLRLDRAVIKVSVLAALGTLVGMLLLGQAFEGMGLAWARSLGYALMAALSLEALRRKQLLTLLLGRSSDILREPPPPIV